MSVVERNEEWKEEGGMLGRSQFRGEERIGTGVEASTDEETFE